MTEHIADATGQSTPENGTMRVDNNAAWVNFVNSNGTSVHDPLARFKSSDRDQSSPGLRYFGFLDITGSWYIMRSSGANNLILEDRYVAGSSAFTTNWANRSGLTYGLFNDIF